MKKFINKILRPFGFLVIKAISTSSPEWTQLFTNDFSNVAKENVNNQTALTVSTLYACIRNVSEDIAKMPLKIYIKKGQTRIEKIKHPLVHLLQHQPNPDMTAISFRETMNAQAMGWGNAYAEIQRDISGNVISLWPLRPDRVSMYQTKGSNRCFYRVMSSDGQFSDIWAEDILHLHGLGFDGITGYNIISYAAQSIGAAIGMEKFAGSYFANGLHQSGNIKHPNNLSKEAQQRLKEQLRAEYGGADKAHQLLILEEGMEFAPNIIDPKASQMIETRQFSVSEFCRWLRVPPHKVADLSKATFSNIEEQNIDYVQDGLLGWCERWEQALWWKLLTPKEKDAGYYFEHNVEGLLRGNVKARLEAYALMWDRGVYCINDILMKENMNPIPFGDLHFVPMNFITLEKAAQQTGEAVGSLVEDIAQRLANREIKELEKHTKHAEQDLDKFREWLEKFYSKHDRYISKAITPLLGDASVNIDMLSLKPFIQMTTVPTMIMDDRKGRHAEYIANNLRGYYEN